MNGKNQITIKSYPRIHLSLIGMNNDGYRINGGIGFTITDPAISCVFEKTNEFIIDDKRKVKFNINEEKKLLEVLSSISKKNNFSQLFKCTIDGDALPHYGLGSNSSIYLSCVEALFLLNKKEDYNKDSIVANSKRGGTSGIGINTYFDGGFVFDVGIPNSHNNELIPSSIAKREGKIPTVIHQCNLPNWNIGICIPYFIKNKSESEEIVFFEKHCPIHKDDVQSILYESVYGVTSSIIENDYPTFCKSVNAIQKTKWKELERSLYGISLIELENQIYNFGADCVGMSSLGPTLFFMGEDLTGIITQISRHYPNTLCYKTTLNNKPRQILYGE